MEELSAGLARAIEEACESRPTSELTLQQKGETNPQMTKPTKASHISKSVAKRDHMEVGEIVKALAQLFGEYTGLT